MLVQATVGPQSAQSIQPGTLSSIRLGQLNDLIASELHGRYYEGGYRKTRFGGASQAAVATSAAFATTYTGLALFNPNGTAVNGVLEKVGIAPIVAQSSPLAVGIMVGQSTTAMLGVTLATFKSKNIGSGTAPVLQLATAVTLPLAPTLDTILGYVGTGATTVDQMTPTLFDLEGSIVIPPGGYVCIYTNVASAAASLLLSMQWEEVPV